MASPPALPLDLFVTLSTHLDSPTLSALSRTSRTLYSLLTPVLKRHHVFRLVAPFISTSYRAWPKDTCTINFLSLARLSRSCRTIHHALAPHMDKAIYYYTNYFIIAQAKLAACSSVEYATCSPDGYCPAAARIDSVLTALGAKLNGTRLDGVRNCCITIAARMSCASVVQVYLDHGFCPLVVRAPAPQQHRRRIRK